MEPVFSAVVGITQEEIEQIRSGTALCKDLRSLHCGGDWLVLGSRPPSAAFLIDLVRCGVQGRVSVHLFNLAQLDVLEHGTPFPAILSEGISVCVLVCTDSEDLARRALDAGVVSTPQRN